MSSRLVLVTSFLMAVSVGCADKNGNWNNISSRPSYTEAIINYETGEWKPELIGLYGEGPNDHNDLLWTEINKLIEEK